MKLSDFERRIERNSLRFRSQRLNAVVAAISSFVSGQTEERLRTLEAAIQTWKFTDPKEYASRGKPIEHEFADALHDLINNRWPPGRFPLITPESHPQYEPRIWNVENVRKSTNCYAYACDDPTNHYVHFGDPSEAGLAKPQPGFYLRMHERGATTPRGINESSIRQAVMLDDHMRGVQQRLMPRSNSSGRGIGPELQKKLVPLLGLPTYNSNQPNQVINKANFYLIALVIDARTPNPDYHWYRQDRSGYWSHKPGHDEATDRDGSGRRILDPRDCDLGRYSFSMFYYAPKGGVRTASLGDMLYPPALDPTDLDSVHYSVSHEEMRNNLLIQSIRSGNVSVAKNENGPIGTNSSANTTAEDWLWNSRNRSTR